MRSRLTERTAERAEKACGSSAGKRRGQRAFEAPRVGKPRVGIARLVKKTIVRHPNGSGASATEPRASRDRACGIDHPSIGLATNARAAQIAGRMSHRRARATRGNDDVDVRVLSLGTEGISRTRTFFATTLVFLAAARLAETPRVVKAPARAEAEAIVVVCGCCDAGARGKYDRRTARARRSFPLTRSSWPSSLPSGKEISRAIWEGHLTGEESGISRKRIFDLPSAESVEIDEI